MLADVPVQRVGTGGEVQEQGYAVVQGWELGEGDRGEPRVVESAVEEMSELRYGREKRENGVHARCYGVLSQIVRERSRLERANAAP